MRFYNAIGFRPPIVVAGPYPPSLPGPYWINPSYPGGPWSCGACSPCGTGCLPRYRVAPYGFLSAPCGCGAAPLPPPPPPPPCGSVI